MTAIADPIAVALLVADALETLNLRYTVGGSLASSMSGEPRSTLGVDMVVAISKTDIGPLAAALSGEFYVSEDALRRAVRERSTANLIQRVQEDRLDRIYLERTAALIGVDDLLQRALGELSGSA